MMPTILFFLAYLAVTTTIGALCFDYALYSWLGLDGPWYLDVIGSVIMSGVTLPLTVLTWVLDVAGATFPLVQL